MLQTIAALLRSQDIMDSLSGIQRYMLFIDTNKSAAQEIVKDVAQSMKNLKCIYDLICGAYRNQN